MSDGLRVSGVRAGYGETVVLEDIAFSLPERGSLAVLGRNGVGKTTLLSTVIGHTTFHSGTIEYQGRPIAGLPAYERVRLGIGYVPQEREIFPSLTVEENLTVAAQPGRWTLERVYELFPGIER
ncbi:MAG TPA: ATP-binding cassette domain-containing protein, partial [Burkholderiales bacterium]|nr:ATP-binding cassette domain-containing protein [Burkholderiales bacterium]